MEKTKYSRTKPNSNTIFQSSPEEDPRRKTSNIRKLPGTKKEQDINYLTTKPKGENHKYINPRTKTNILMGSTLL